MLNKERFNGTLTALNEIAAHYPKVDFSSGLEGLKEDVSAFDIKLIFSGHFNAGKSSLINCLIERPDFLTEGQVPTTAIAAELKYSSEQYAEVYTSDGKMRRCELDDVAINGSIDHIEYFIDSAALDKLSDFTVVDTPGFDSGIEEHNKALNSYLPYGSYYVVVVNIEKGELDIQTLNFIREISNYSSNIVILLNHCDKHTQEHIDEIKEHIEWTLEQEGLSCRVYCVSKYDEGISDRLVDILQSFDSQTAFDGYSSRLIKIQAENMKGVLTALQKQYEDADTFDLEKEVHGLERAKQQIDDSLAKAKKEAEDSYPQRLDQIRNEISSALSAGADSVVTALLNGGSNAAEAVIMEIVRPLIMNNIKDYYDGTISGVAVDMANAVSQFEGVSKSYGDLVLSITKNAKEIINSDLFSKKNNGDADKAKKTNAGKNAYHVVTGLLAITTNVIAPWLEVVLIIAPDVIMFFKKMFGESDYDKAKKIYRTAVIPQVMNRLYDPLSNAIQESNDSFIKFLEEQANEKLMPIKDSITKNEQEKEKILQESKSFKEIIKADLEILDRLIENQ